jgi:hypothetical protein
MNQPIQISQHPLPNPLANEIRDWLHLPAAQKYIRYLSDLAAEEAAESGNAQVKGQEPDLVDSETHADNARNLLNAIELLLTHSARDYNFPIADLKTNPNPNPQTEE